MGKRHPLGSVNLGYYPTEEAAHAAAIAFRRLGPSAEKVPELIAELQKRGVARSGLLPPWVYRLGGGGFGARRRTRSGVVALAGPFETAGEAYRAMLTLLTRKTR